MLLLDFRFRQSSDSPLNTVFDAYKGSLLLYLCQCLEVQEGYCDIQNAKCICGDLGNGSTPQVHPTRNLNLKLQWLLLISFGTALTVIIGFRGLVVFTQWLNPCQGNGCWPELLLIRELLPKHGWPLGSMLKANVLCLHYKE